MSDSTTICKNTPPSTIHSDDRYHKLLKCPKFKFNHSCNFTNSKNEIDLSDPSIKIKPINPENINDVYISKILEICHPEIISEILGFTTNLKNELCIIVPNMTNGSLQDYINKKPGCIILDKISILNMFLKIIDAIKYLNSIGLYIMDLQPSDIIFDNNGRPKLDIFTLDININSNLFKIKKDMDSNDKKMNKLIKNVDIINSFGLLMFSIITQNVVIEEVVISAYDIFINGTFDNLKHISKLEWDFKTTLDFFNLSMDCFFSTRRFHITLNYLSSKIKEIYYYLNDVNKINNSVFGDISNGFSTDESEPLNLNNLCNFNLSGNETGCACNDKIEQEESHFVHTEKNKLSLKISFLNYFLSPSQQLNTNSKMIKSCIIKINKNSKNLDFVEKMVKKQKNSFRRCHTIENESMLEIYDTKWIKSNLKHIITNSEIVNFNNINVFEINENIVITNNIQISSNIECHFNLKNNHSILIKNKANVKIEKINIKNISINANHSIELYEDSNLTIKNSLIKNNKTKKSIFFVSTGCCLNLCKTIFEANVITVKFKQPSCILCQINGNVDIRDCEFLNHYIEKYSFSAELIKTEGNLFISSCNFENNFANCGLHTISIIGNGIFTVKNSYFITSSSIYCSYLKSITIENSNFDNNSSYEEGGALCLKDCGEIKIRKTNFINNFSAWTGGAIFIGNNDGKLFLTNCNFYSNCTIKDGFNGGAIYIRDTKCEIVKNKFKNNISDKDGGAIFAHKSDINFKDCAFESNIALENGDHIHNVGSKVTFLNEIIFLN